MGQWSLAGKGWIAHSALGDLLQLAEFMYLGVLFSGRKEEQKIDRCLQSLLERAEREGKAVNTKVNLHSSHMVTRC